MALAKELKILPQAQANAAAIVNGTNQSTEDKGFSMEWLKGFFNKPKVDPQKVKWVEEDGSVRES